MSAAVLRATTERQPTESGAFTMKNTADRIKDWLESLPADHTYRVHGTRHVDIAGGTFQILKVDTACEWCRSTFGF